MNLFKAVATVGGLTLLSRIIGFARDVLTAAFMGAGIVADAFFVALKLPNLFRRITAEGAFSIAFVPQYTGTLEKDGVEEARRYAEESMALMLGIMIPFTVVAIAVMPWLLYVVAPGIVDEPERYGLAVELSRITFPYLLLMSLSALMGGILNSTDRFAPFAAAPVLFNIVMIIVLLVGTPILQTPGHALAWGVSISGIVQLLWMIWFVRKYGLMPGLRRPKMTVRMKKLFRLMGPGVIGSGVVQINLFIDIVIASFLPAGAISYLYYADRLNQLPLGVIGIAMGTVLLPILAKAASTKNSAELNRTFNKALEYSLLLAMPAAGALIVLAAPILHVLFERGEFEHTDTLRTAPALMAYALGLVPYVLIRVLNATFYAHEDTMSPVKATIISTIINTGLSITLVLTLPRVYAHVGVALATGLSSFLHLFLISRALKRTGWVTLTAEFKSRALRIFLCSSGMFFVLLYALLGTLWPDYKFESGLMHYILAGDVTEKIIGLAILIAIGKSVYFILTLLTGVFKWGEVKQLLNNKEV